VRRNPAGSRGCARGSCHPRGRSIGAGGIQLEVGRIDYHIDARQLAELADLLVGERRLSRTAPAEDVDGADAAGRQRLERIVGDVGFCQLLVRAGEDARHVHRDVPVAHHRADAPSS